MDLDLKTVSQVCIAFFGVTAITLSQSASPRLRRYACLFGLAGQPFWFVSAWLAAQWGVFGLCVLYTLAWLKGVWVHWVQPYRKGSAE